MELGRLRIALNLDDVDFKKGLQAVQRELKASQAEFRSIVAGSDRYKKSTEQLIKEQKSLERVLEVHKLKIEEVRNEWEAKRKELGDNAKESKDLEAQYYNSVAAMERTERTLKKIKDRLQEQQDPIKKTVDRLEKLEKGFKKAGDAMQDIGKKMTMRITAPVAAIGGAAIKASIDFESAFAGVRKTVDATEAEFAELEQGILDMTKKMPASAEEIAAVAEAAGQLGIQTENILAFTETMINLGEATNLTSDDAATSFARFANIVGMNQNDFDRLGSVVVDLGNNMATTEAEIVNMATRLAAQGAQVGMSEAQIMALAGTLSSLGIEAEAGGTAMSTVLKKIQNAVGKGGHDLDAFAKAAGVSSKEFKAAFEKDAVVGLDMLIKGLSNSSSNGKNLTQILESLAISGIRESDTMLRLAGASDLLSDAVDGATGAWEENTALANEAAQRYETTASQIKILWNEIKLLSLEIGEILLPIVQDLLKKLKPIIERFGEMEEETKKNILIFAGVAAAIGPLLIVIGTLISSIGKIIGVAKLLIPVIAGITAPVWAIIGAVAAAVAVGVLLWKNWTKIQNIAQKLYDKFGAFSFVIAAMLGPIGQLIFAGALISKNWEAIKKKTIEVWTAVSDWIKTACKNISTAFQNVKQFLETTWKNIQTGAKVAWQTLTRVVMAIVTPFINGVTNIFSHMKSGIENIFTGISTFFKGIWELIKNVVVGAVLLIVDLVTGDFEGFKRDLANIFLNIKNAFDQIWQGIKQIFVGTAQAMVGYVIAQIENLRTVVTNVFSAVRDFFQNTWSNIRTAAKTGIDNIKTAVVEKFVSVVSGVKETFGKVKGTISTAWETAVQFLKDIDLKQIGKDIIGGLIDGITEKSASLVVKVGEVAKSIKDKARGVLKIKSPSRVMRDDVGKWIPLGIAEGIQRNIQTVRNAATKMAHAAFPTSTAHVPAFTHGSPVSNNTTTNYAPSITINGGSDASSIAREIERLNRRHAFKGGIPV